LTIFISETDFFSERLDDLGFAAYFPIQLVDSAARCVEGLIA
jgi:hypothetical protein